MIPFIKKMKKNNYFKENLNMELTIDFKALLIGIRQAIESGFNITTSVWKECNSEYFGYCFNILKNDNDYLYIEIQNDSYNVRTPGNGFIDVEHKVTEKEKNRIEALRIEIEEINEKEACSYFNNFFNSPKKEIKDINDLDIEDD